MEERSYLHPSLYLFCPPQRHKSTVPGKTRNRDDRNRPGSPVTGSLYSDPGAAYNNEQDEQNQNDTRRSEQTSYSSPYSATSTANVSHAQSSHIHEFVVAIPTLKRSGHRRCSLHIRGSYHTIYDMRGRPSRTVQMSRRRKVFFGVGLFACFIGQDTAL